MKHPLSLLLLLACTSDNIKAATKRKSLSEEIQNLFDALKSSSPLSLNELEDKVELSIELPENFPAEDTTIDIKDNRSFKITVKKNNDTLIVNGLQQGSSLVINSSIQQESAQEEKDKNSTSQASQKSLSSSNLQQLVLSRLDFKDLTVEHDEETNSLVISIPKIVDPNTKSIKTAIPKRQKQQSTLATK
ncbi:hypothetical protein EBU24_03505 [bacterium]|nr:hypothetical protein [bacterium]